MRSIFILIILFILVASSNSAPLPSSSWDWQLSVEQIEPPKGIKAFGTDPDSVSKEQIKALNKAGVYTICYVSVGTAENWRDDVNSFHSQMVGKTYGDWPDEKFLNIANPSLLPIMEKQFANCALKGFKAIEPDNLDVYENDSGFDISRNDTLNYIRNLAKIAHSKGLEIGQKNVPELTDQLVGMMDFIISESCYQDKWCEDILPYIKAGKPIFDAEYNDREIDFEAACAYAKKQKISMILKDRDLSAQYQSCPQ